MTVDSPPRPPRPDTRPATRGTWALRDRPAVVWLALAVLLTLVHPFVPGSRWLMVHLVLLGALTHSALVWSTHFTRPSSRRRALWMTGGCSRFGCRSTSSASSSC